MVKVIIKDNESVDKALKRFKRKIEQSTILKDLKNKEFFLKPSVRKKLKRRMSLARNRKREKKINYRLHS